MRAGIALAALIASGILPAFAAERADALKKVDLEFAAMAQTKGLEAAFAEYAAPDGITFGGEFEPVTGPQAIGRMHAGDDSKLEWRPAAAALAASGELGFTWGRWRLTAHAADGQPQIRYGKYVTVWRKQKNGSWRFVLDTGNSNAPPPPGVPDLPR